MNDLSQALNRLRKVLLILYASVLISSIAVFFTLNYFHHRSLAESFALSARSSLVINDLRQAMFSLSPALNSNFEAVQFLSQEGTLIFSLPPENKAWNGLFITRYDVPIFTNPDDPSVGSIGSLLFFQNSGRALGWALFAWFILLICAVPFSRWARKQIENRHKELLTLGNAEAKAGLARQVAHDIRSPLSALMMLEKVANGMTTEQRELLTGTARRINKIAQDLLDKTQIEGSVCKDPAQVIEQVIAEKYAAMGPNSPIKLRKGHLPKGGIMISPTLFARIISNLLNNAIESMEGPGHVYVEGLAQGNKAVFSIRDTGKGMSAKILAQVGKPGFTFGKTGGSGLGLSHASAAIRAHGGDLRIESQEGVGTCVSITVGTE